jgi:hypothetical protein
VFSKYRLILHATDSERRGASLRASIGAPPARKSSKEARHEIVAKLLQVDVVVSQRRNVADAIAGRKRAGHFRQGRFAAIAPARPKTCSSPAPPAQSSQWSDSFASLPPFGAVCARLGRQRCRSGILGMRRTAGPPKGKRQRARNSHLQLQIPRDEWVATSSIEQFGA